MQTGGLIAIGDREIIVQMLSGGAHILAGCCGYSFKEECVSIYGDPIGEGETHIFPLMNVERITIGAKPKEKEVPF